MIFNVILRSKNVNIPDQKLKGFDGRPLRFTSFNYALREANERNINNKLSDADEVKFIVIEERHD